MRSTEVSTLEKAPVEHTEPQRHYSAGKEEGSVHKDKVVFVVLGADSNQREHCGMP